jgi:hypothetical protein
MDKSDAAPPYEAVVRGDPAAAESKIGNEPGVLTSGDATSSLKGEDILALQDLDPAMHMKMHLVNNVSWILYHKLSMPNNTSFLPRRLTRSVGQTTT